MANNPIQIPYSGTTTNTPSLGVGAGESNIALNGPDELLFYYDGTTTKSFNLAGGNGVFTMIYISPDQAITPAGPLTLAHGLGIVPHIVTLTLVCQTAEHGYTAGNLVEVAMGAAFKSNDAGTSVVKDATNLNVRYGAGSGGSSPVFTVIHKTTGIDQNITNANWKCRFRAFG